MKKVFLMVVVALCVATASAQINLGVNAGVQVPTASGGKTAFGVGINGEYLIMPNIGVGANLGYYIFDRTEGVTSFVMPIVLTGKYYILTDNFRPYGGVDLGFYRIGASGGGFSSSVTKAGFAPVAGFQFGFTDNLALDVNAKYTHILTEYESTGLIGFHVGIVYTIGR